MYFGTLPSLESHRSSVEFALTAALAGGSDTTVSTLMTFFLEMIRNPEVQRRAQEELDRVVGPDRLPTFSDREALPYLEAVIREAYRILPVAPLGETTCRRA